MVRLRELLGSAPAAHFACMYTKHKTQKRKTWHDGFVTLYASRRLVLYDEAPLAGILLETAKVVPDVWDRRDEDYIDVPKFLIEILDPTPINVDGGASSTPTAAASPSASASEASAPYQDPSSATSNRVARGPSAINGRFKTPFARPRQARGPMSSAPAPRSRPHPYALATGRGGPSSGRNGAAEAARFDFERHPTSEWDYKPGAIKRTPDQVLTLLGQL